MSCSPSNVVGLVIIVVVSVLLAPQFAVAADVYGDPVFTFSMDALTTVDGFFQALQSCLDIPSMSQGGHDVGTDGNRATVKFTLVDAPDVVALKRYIDQDTASMQSCLHTKISVTNVVAGYAVVTAPPATASPSSFTKDKMLEIGLPLGGCFIGVVFGLIVAFFCIRARNARLAEEAEFQGDLNQPMTVKTDQGGVPLPRKAAPAPVRRGADLA